MQSSLPPTAGLAVSLGLEFDVVGLTSRTAFSCDCSEELATGPGCKEQSSLDDAEGPGTLVDETTGHEAMLVGSNNGSARGFKRALASKSGSSGDDDEG